MRGARAVWIAACLGMSAAFPAFAQEGRQPRRFDVDGVDVNRLAEALAYPGEGGVPAWAQDEPPPRFRFVQISDIHHRMRGDSERVLVRALEYLRDELRPAFILITGDNVTGDSAAHHAHLKGVLDRHAWQYGRGSDPGDGRAPYFIVTGDNDRRHYVEVFGSYHYSFDYGGLHFLLTGLDIDDHGDGIGRYAEETWGWMGSDLRAHPEQATFFIQHENLVPPVYDDAGRALRLVQAHPQVVATLTGHLHFDFQCPTDGPLHLVGPSINQDSARSFKVYEVQPTHITVRTVELRSGRPEWHPTKYQRIAIPSNCRDALAAPLGVRNYAEIPSRPVFREDIVPPIERLLRALRSLRRAGRALSGEQ